MSFEFKKLTIPEVILIIPRIFRDSRGFFMESYKRSEFSKAGIREEFVQDNHSYSRKDVLRGLHYQREPMAQGKLIRCIRGRIYDVAVDIRRGSPTYKRWVGIELTEENNYMVYIPEGFAHGFVVLSDEAVVIYKCTKEYSKENERGIIWNDPEISIEWPVKLPVLSERDSKLPLLKDAEINFTYKGK